MKKARLIKADVTSQHEHNVQECGSCSTPTVLQCVGCERSRCSYCLNDATLCSICTNAAQPGRRDDVQRALSWAELAQMGANSQGWR